MLFVDDGHYSASAFLSVARLIAYASSIYTLHPGDVLDVQYRYTPEFNQTLTVQPDGYISLEIGGDLKVGGRTLQGVSTGRVHFVVAFLRDPYRVLHEPAAF